MQNQILMLITVGLSCLIMALLLVIRNLRRQSSHGSGVSKLANSLRDEKLKSEIILNTIEDGVVLIDDQRTIQLFNPGASAITGWTSSDAVGLTWQAVFHIVNKKGEALDPIQDPMAKVFGTKQTIRDNAASLLTKSGKIMALNIVASPIIDKQQQVTGAVGIFRDVSEERQEEQQRAEFISTASHEMRTPVAAIEGYLALALNDKVSNVDSRARGYLEKAHASTEHLGKLFQDLLTSAKAEDGRLTSHPDVIEISAYLQQLVGDLRFSAEKKGLGVEYIFGPYRTIDASKGKEGENKVINPLYNTYVDPDRLREAITNLFDNAVKYTEEGKVSIGLTANDQVIQFFIRDTGPGIPPEDITHLFQKFYRVDNTATRAIGGTGLGLFICRKIVELYGGRIWVESELGKGSTFYVNLPRLSSAKAEELKAKSVASNILPPMGTSI
jgi:PAS domain S-box-containing protein